MVLAVGVGDVEVGVPAYSVVDMTRYSDMKYLILRICQVSICDTHRFLL